MSSPEAYFHQLGKSIANSQTGQMFGWSGYKLNRKFFAYFQKEVPLAEAASCAMVFRLKAEDATLAFALPGAEAFNPAGDRPMKNWVVLPDTLIDYWPEFTELAAENVRNL